MFTLCGQYEYAIFELKSHHGHDVVENFFLEQNESFQQPC